MNRTNISKQQFKILETNRIVELINIIKKYVNLFKALHFIDPSIAQEFKKKQEHFHSLKHNHTSEESGSCCGSKLNSKIYIPKDQMNNIEKNLNDLYSSFYYENNIEDLLNFLNTKFENITKSGIKDGLELDLDSENQLLHRLLLEGIPFYISDRLKTKLLNYEENISEQPMLLAHPSGVTNDDLVSFINPKYISEIINHDYTVINSKVYPDVNEYQIYNQYRYLYLEGNFEDASLKNGGERTDLMLNYAFNFFKKSKHIELNEFSNLVYYLPYELNKKYSNFQLQTNEYLQASYFCENASFINTTMDSSFTAGKDTGKKLTVVFALFPENLELSKRKLNLKLKYQSDVNADEKEEINIELTNPLSCIIFKSRKFSYQIEKHNFPFVLVFYYIHGPIEKSTFSC